MNKAMYSSETPEWSTPQYLFDELKKEFGLHIDCCATKENAKCNLYWDKESDGLSQDWDNHHIWMNPPYGREIGKWVKKASEIKGKHGMVVCLLPARTDTKWFHDYIYNKSEIRFIKGRLKFGDSKNSAPFPSMIVIYKENK